MAFQILPECILCDMCIPECPNEAIAYQRRSAATGAAAPVRSLHIDPDRCTECVGFYDHPTCVAVCPIDVVIPLTTPP